MLAKQIYTSPEVDILVVQVEDAILTVSPGTPGGGNGYNDYPDDF